MITQKHTCSIHDSTEFEKNKIPQKNKKQLYDVNFRKKMCINTKWKFHKKFEEEKNPEALKGTVPI